MANREFVIDAQESEGLMMGQEKFASSASGWGSPVVMLKMCTQGEGTESLDVIKKCGIISNQKLTSFSPSRAKPARPLEDISQTNVARS